MKPGEMVEMAIWLSGAETPQQIEEWMVHCRMSTDNAARHYQVEVGPFEWRVKRPGEERVPQVPDNIQGIDVRLLVGEAKVLPLNKSIIHRQGGFTIDLPKEDRERLRRLTRRAHQRTHPGDRLNDKQCDAIIEYLGPDVAAMTLRHDKANA